MPRVAVNGVSLHYEETGVGPPLLLIPAFPVGGACGSRRWPRSRGGTGSSPTTSGAFMARAIPGAQIWRVPNATHFINLDEPDLFNQKLLDSLAS